MANVTPSPSVCRFFFCYVVRMMESSNHRLIIPVAVLVTLFLNADFRQGVIGVALWFVAGLGCFGFYARHRMVRSPEEAFALKLDEART